MVSLTDKNHCSDFFARMIPYLNSIRKPGYGATSTPCSSRNSSRNDATGTVLINNNTCDENDNVCFQSRTFDWFGIVVFLLFALIVTEVTHVASLSALTVKFLSIVRSDSPAAPSAGILRFENPTASCTCTVEKSSSSGQYCKSLLLLRHAKSSWGSSFFVDDINRHISKKGIAVAHDVGRSLNHMNVKLPDLILSSPSVRTEETLNIVLGEWMLGAESQKNTKVKLRFKSASKEQHEKLNEKLVENNVKIQYSDALYSLSDEGYLHHLVAVLRDNSQFNKGNQPGRVLIVGHNPAIEDLLNYLSNATLDTSHRHFAPGQFYEICFPDLESWADLEQTTVKGIISLLLPLQN